MTVLTADSGTTALFKGPGAGPFTYGFFIRRASEIIVTRTTAAQVETELLESQYTITGIGTITGGTVTLVTAMVNGETLILKRRVPFLQQLKPDNKPKFLPDAHEAPYDRIVMMLQDLAEQSGRTYKVPPSENDASPDEGDTPITESPLIWGSLVPHRTLIADFSQSGEASIFGAAVAWGVEGDAFDFLEIEIVNIEFEATTDPDMHPVYKLTADGNPAEPINTHVSAYQTLDSDGTFVEDGSEIGVLGVDIGIEVQTGWRCSGRMLISNLVATENLNSWELVFNDATSLRASVGSSLMPTQAGKIRAFIMFDGDVFDIGRVKDSHIRVWGVPKT